MNCNSRGGSNSKTYMQKIHEQDLDIPEVEQIAPILLKWRTFRGYISQQLIMQLPLLIITEYYLFTY